MDIEEEWMNFCNNNEPENIKITDTNTVLNQEIPKSSDIYISTKTKIVYLSDAIDLKENFWKISLVDYSNPCEGVIKKQMKYNFENLEEVEKVEELLKKEKIVEQHVISKNKPSSQFKDVRKISIGICRKDIMSHRSKKKSAFYNCFVLIIRLKINNIFKEAHVKIFNTGKLEIPGIQTDEFMDEILKKLLDIFKNNCNLVLNINKDTCETVLINSNFTCGYYVNREKLHDILKYKYKIHTSYDPCSYPGIMSKFWYNNDSLSQTGIKESNNSQQVSFMIFRTGSVLIVGKCNESILLIIYEYLKELFISEYSHINQTSEYDIKNNNKIKKKRKKILKITVSN
tara:strand:+ start:3146 stop:4174 length:1029 start_codon:yes stop_codon:yes gene_type:complete